VRYVAAFVVVVIVAAGVIGGIQWTRSIPAPTFHEQPTSEAITLPGGSPKLPWPTTGSAAVGIEGLGTLGTYGTDSPQAIASIAKVMTADVILKDHPLSAGEAGPRVTFDAADVSTYQSDLAGSQSVVKVVSGESLTEMQLLEALLIPSANNIAQKLAVWDASSVGAFVDKMNATAKRLGLTDSEFTDPSGLQATTDSTATDLIKLGEDAMRNKVFASIVAMPQITLPYAGTVYNFDYDLGRDGIVGIKTGSDSVAGGCFLFETLQKVGARTLTVVGVVLGQQTSSPITAALSEAELIAKAVPRDLHDFTAVASGLVVGHITTAWNSSTDVSTSRALTVFGWPGERLTSRLQIDPALPAHITRGVKIGTLYLNGPGFHGSTPVEATGSITGPSASWKLER
jgi:serine-type D-Ala-D-Ala carboxypeptidase (penicillin-binding protein 5/6)